MPRVCLACAQGKMYGCVDAVFGEDVCFVYADDKMSRGVLLKPEEVKILSKDDPKAATALKNSIEYFRREKKELEWRLTSGNEFDKPEYIKPRLEYVNMWLGRLESHEVA